MSYNLLRLTAYYDLLLYLKVKPHLKMAGRNILKSLQIVRDRAFINGNWINNSKTFPVMNPATGEVTIFYNERKLLIL